MSHQIAQSDRPSKRWMNLKVQICVYVSIEIEFALLHKLHHRNPGKKFCDGREAKNRAGRIDRLFLFGVSEAIALLQQHFVILHYQYRCPGNIGALELQRNNAVKERSEVLRIKRMCGWRIRRRCLRSRLLRARSLRRDVNRWLRLLCDRWGKRQQNARNQREDLPGMVPTKGETFP